MLANKRQQMFGDGDCDDEHPLVAKLKEELIENGRIESSTELAVDDDGFIKLSWRSNPTFGADEIAAIRESPNWVVAFTDIDGVYVRETTDEDITWVRLLDCDENMVYFGLESLEIETDRYADTDAHTAYSNHEKGGMWWSVLEVDGVDRKYGFYFTEMEVVGDL